MLIASSIIGEMPAAIIAVSSIEINIIIPLPARVHRMHYMAWKSRSGEWRRSGRVIDP